MKSKIKKKHFSLRIDLSYEMMDIQDDPFFTFAFYTEEKRSKLLLSVKSCTKQARVSFSPIEGGKNTVTFSLVFKIIERENDIKPSKC